MSLRARYKVGTRKFSEGPDKDPRGNKVKRWAPAVEQRAICWGPANANQAEPKVVGHDRVVVELELCVPEGFDVGPQDKVIIAGAEYDAIGYPEDFNNGPFGFRPGMVVNLKRVEG
ncbi:hypothetical protein [Antrihabitans cavernicola]|uniref:Head-tail adaptor protein n=1 Tax=Antrihabitans cavernicola TaxID=2495913 RepID=A0A5A7S997_9NOCA|nr:hypothetical protein [Spelaeibacter cavernicola]KAA0021809.1 hypothetical protein FOY51_15505 [Spelaeibacter cavernicola]